MHTLLFVGMATFGVLMLTMAGVESAELKEGTATAHRSGNFVYRHNYSIELISFWSCQELRKSAHNPICLKKCISVVTTGVRALPVQVHSDWSQQWRAQWQRWKILIRGLRFSGAIDTTSLPVDHPE